MKQLKLSPTRKALRVAMAIVALIAFVKIYSHDFTFIKGSDDTDKYVNLVLHIILLLVVLYIFHKLDIFVLIFGVVPFLA